jgi:hypothetical protein
MRRTYGEDEGLWASSGALGLWYELARPPHAGEQPIDPPLVPELYEVLNRAEAHVRVLEVADSHR